MRRDALWLAGAAAAALLLTACASGVGRSALIAHSSMNPPATRGTSRPPVARLTTPSATTASAPHPTAPAKSPAAARTSQRAVSAASAAPRYPVVTPPSGTPWTWPQGTPPPCTPSKSGSSGAMVFAILMENQNDGPTWNGQSEDDANCFAYTMGTVNFTAKTAQLLMRDTADGAQKAFTGHLGDVVSLGRFTIKVDPPDPAYGSKVVFEVDIYWA